MSELGAELGVRQPLLSQQLTVLRGAHVVTTRRAAKQVFYRLTPGKLDPLRGLFSAIHEGSAPRGLIRDQPGGAGSPQP